VVLVDEQGLARGTMEKLQAHTAPGHLHRAVSLCLFDDQDRVLLQRRADRKYHFAGRWSNSCCTHPRPGEDPVAAVVRRTHEELGIAIDGLVECGTFVYRATDPRSGLVEWEVDHVFAASPVGRTVPHPDEVSGVRWVVAAAARDEASASPDCTPWLGGVLDLACTQWFTNPDERASVA
jgi:isopentenyl-diphosphate delta-isomerase